MAGPTRVNTPDVPQFVEHRLATSLRDYLVNLSAFIQRELRRRPEAGTAVDSVLLQSPNNSVYQISVDDAGAIVSTLVSSP